MKYFSLKILLLCIIIPPVFYILTIQGLEKKFHQSYLNEIETVYIGDPDPLLKGAVGLREEVKTNIDKYLKGKVLTAWGMKIDVAVTTKNGTVIYPPFFEQDIGQILSHDSMQTAKKNFELMNQGLVVNVDLVIDNNTTLANLILTGYIILSALILSFHYKNATNLAKQEEDEQNRELKQLKTVYDKNLNELEQEKSILVSEFETAKIKLESLKLKSSKNEEEMIHEIIDLEEKLKANLDHQEEQNKNIEELKKKTGLNQRKKTKYFHALEKRFRALYKNLVLNERAIEGFIDLNDDLKIKSEEIIYQLNQNPKLVTVKRKVFGKKSMGKIFEVVFAYKGRLYFRNIKGNKIEVLAMGTKNTQSKEMAFLAGL